MILDTSFQNRPFRIICHSSHFTFRLLILVHPLPFSWVSGLALGLGSLAQVSVLPQVILRRKSYFVTHRDLQNRSRGQPKSPKVDWAKVKPQSSRRRHPVPARETQAPVTLGQTRGSPVGPALALTPDCTRWRNAARFNATDSKASGTQWEGRARTSCSVKQAKKNTDFAGRWGGWWKEEDVEFRGGFFPCVYSRQLDNNKGAMWINTTAELMVHSA